jgi:hypothetical protein
MSAGLYPPATTLAGFGPVVANDANRRALPPAPLVDKASREVPLETTGLVKALHPVDSQVSIGLGFRQGTIGGDPTIGHSFHLVSLAQPQAQLQADVEQRARAANPIKRLLDAGDIEIISVQAERLPSGLQVVTHYRNMRTGIVGRVQAT